MTPLSSAPTPIATATKSAQSPNRIAYIRLFARVLCVVAHYAPLTVRVRDTSSSTEFEASGIGQRIAGLIESLAEGERMIQYYRKQNFLYFLFISSHLIRK